jgi:Protein of unknown function (DUF2950)
MNKLSTLLKSLATTLIVVASASITVSFAARAQQAYETPQKAVDALVAAAKSDDVKGILAVLGQGGQDIASSGDKVADAALLDRFVATYDAKHSVAAEGETKATLIVGGEDYPFPIPLVRGKNGRWSFDTVAGRREILYRRIGDNELSTIQTCLAYVDAQDEYASKDRTGDGRGTYAQRFFSSTGKKDGLYWKTAEGEDQSPLGELFADASAEGYKVGEGPTPYHGYYYKILTKQGPAVPGGAADYIVNGKMIGGFALVAYPAEYRNSGVMTFVVNYSDVLYQKDFGPNTGTIAAAMTTYEPDSTWTKVDAADEATK